MRGASTRRSLTLLLMALVSLFEVGCQSGLSGPCGASPCGATSGCGSHNYFSRLRARVFNRGTTEYYGGTTLGAEAPLEASPVVTPGATVTTPSTITTPGSTSVLPSAPVESAPTDLAPLGTPASPTEKIPSAAPGPPSDSGALKPSGNRANYEASGARSRYSRARGDSVTRTMVTTSEPASRSARGTPLDAPLEPSDALLENLPPVEVPHEWSTNETPIAKNETRSPARAVEPPAEHETTQVETTASVPAEVSVVPGIRRFSGVEPKLAGGSLPTLTGLDWLAEKGYKTLLDLRDTKDVQASYIEEVTKRGLRYVVLPIGLQQVDSNHISRFNDELALADARPLYFCDTDGTRAGVLWYIRRMTVDKIDAASASREAETLGLTDKAYWQAATKYLESLGAAPARSTTVAPAANPPAPTAVAPAATRSVSNDPPMPDPAPAPAPAPAAAAAVKTEEPAKPEKATTQAAPAVATELASSASPESETVQPRDSTSWHSYAALVVTGLGVPLAYWSRTALPSLRILSRASLPGPGRRPKSIPASSGE